MPIVNRQEFYVPGVTLLTGNIGYKTTYGSPLRQDDLGGAGGSDGAADNNVVHEGELVQNGGEDVVHTA